MKDSMTVSCLFIIFSYTKIPFPAYFPTFHNKYEQIMYANFIFHHDSWQYNFSCLLFMRKTYFKKHCMQIENITTKKTKKNPRRKEKKNPFLYREIFMTTPNGC